ncbi:MAG: TIGR01777 family oxidoreductase [Lentisphaerota bacterium]
MKIAVSGSSGFIGSALLPELVAEGHQVLRLARTTGPAPASTVRWNPVTGMVDRKQFEGVEAVIHLAGAPVACTWTPASKALIRDSRVLGTRQLVENLVGLSSRPRVLLCASAIGYYGNRGHQLLNENSPAGSGFLAEVCAEWEGVTELAATAGIRVVRMRLGAVLSPYGGILRRMLPIFRWGLGGPVGDGRQFMSWISMKDTIKAIQFLLGKDSIRGPVNLVSPQPVTNREFSKTLGRALSRPAFFPFPAFAVNLFFGEMGRELLLSSAQVEPNRLKEAGFVFQHPVLGHALEEMAI